MSDENVLDFTGDTSTDETAAYVDESAEILADVPDTIERKALLDLGAYIIERDYQQFSL